MYMMSRPTICSKSIKDRNIANALKSWPATVLYLTGRTTNDGVIDRLRESHYVDNTEPGRSNLTCARISKVRSRVQVSGHAR